MTSAANRARRDVPMLHRVEMDVVHVSRDVGFAAQRLLPVAALPDSTLALVGAAL